MTIETLFNVYAVVCFLSLAISIGCVIVGLLREKSDNDDQNDLEPFNPNSRDHNNDSNSPRL